MKKFAIIAAVAAAFVASGASAATNLVTNGSFELTTLSGKGSFLNHVTGWTGGSGLTLLDFPGTATSFTGGYGVYGPFASTSPDGGKFVQADGDPNYAGAFSQSIAGLVVGQAYRLTFDQAAGQQFNFHGATTERWSVTFGAANQLSHKFSLPDAGVGPWEGQTMDFTATSATQLLTFMAVGTPNGVPPTSFLDGVSLVVVPEPATWGMMIVGLGAMGAAARMRRRQMVAAA